MAGGAIVGTLEEILLSFGIFLLPSAMTDQAQSSDWWYSEDGNAALKPYYDDLASEYEKERFKVINGGGGDPQPSPTPVPEQKPEIQPTPIPQVKPGEIPTFDELVAPALAGGAISWASGAWDTMAKAVGNLWDKMFGRASDVSSDLPEDVVNTIMNSGCPYYYYDIDQFESVHFYLGGIGSFRTSYRAYMFNATDPKAGKQNIASLSFGFASNFNSNLPVFATYEEGLVWSEQQRVNTLRKTSGFTPTCKKLIKTTVNWNTLRKLRSLYNIHLLKTLLILPRN